MTNADVIRKMTDKQLFDFLSEWECGDIDYSITFCDLCEQGKRDGGQGNELGLDCDGCREHWLKRDAVDFGGLLIDCSICGKGMFAHYNDDYPNYCYNCGAKMRCQ